MQYLPVVFAVFQIFFLTGLVIYYIVQTLFRLGQNVYITKRFYHGEHSLGRQAQAAGQRAREEAKANGKDAPAGGMFAQAKREAQERREAQEAQRKGATSGKPAARGGQATKKPGAKAPSGEQPVPSVVSKRVTPPKNRPTPSSNRPQRPTASGRPGAPARPKPPKK
jgi:YidC/Oxa1 family membrane protein insertase